MSDPITISFQVGHHLATSEEFQINKQLHIEKRDKALMTLQTMYIRGRSEQPSGAYPNESEFWAYSILLKLGVQV
jgi:hypothetical protein